VKAPDFIPNNMAHLRYDLSREDYLRHRDRGAIVAYVRQRDTAKSRGIDWLFTFKAWWAMWEASGMWEFRGRTKAKGGWEMSRPGDVGPYSPENVVIVPHKVNMGEVNTRLAARRPPRRELPKQNRYPMSDPANVKRALELSRQGLNYTKIGAVMGLHRSSVRNALQKTLANPAG